MGGKLHPRGQDAPQRDKPQCDPTDGNLYTTEFPHNYVTDVNLGEYSVEIFQMLTYPEIGFNMA